MRAKRLVKMKKIRENFLRFVIAVIFGGWKTQKWLLLLYFSVKKSTKSHLRGLSSLLKNTPPVSATPTNALRALVHSPLLKNTLRVHESVARAMRGECVRQMATQKSAVLCSQQSHPYHACEHITRDSRADSCTHCLHARI